jgi:ABC-2 type transport system ATP-binding protein
MGLLKPTEGRVLAFGLPSTSQPAKQRMGFLPEQPYFYQHLRARELLDFYGRLFGLGGSALRSRIDMLLRMVRLEEHRDTKISEFSKGMLQRMGLAQALINNPDLVILDEPLSGLDPVGRMEMRDLIVKLKSEGRTVFFSSHILQDVEMICDRVAILAKGKVLRTAAVSDVLSGSLTSYEILASNASIDLLGKLSLGGLSTRGEKTVITMTPETDLNAGLKQLLSLGVRIESVNPVRQTLEGYFMKELTASDQPIGECESRDTLLAGSSKVDQ